MKQHLSIIAGVLAALCLPVQAFAQKTQTDLVADGNFGPATKRAAIKEIQITTKDGKPLGRVHELVLDLVNAHIVEVIVVSDQTLRFGGTAVAVPPGAFITNAKNQDYQLDMSQETFADAPKFDEKKWADSTQVEQIAASYRYFGQKPYFYAPSIASKDRSPGAEFVHLGYLESMTKITNMGVKNLKGERLGDLETLVLDIPNCAILKAYVNAGTVGTILKFSTIIKPESLSFNAAHDGLLLDDTKVEYANEPRVVFETGPTGKNISAREEPTTTEPAKLALVQGIKYSDVNTTAQIYSQIRSGKLDEGENVEVATLAGRVTLRGIANSQVDKDSIAAIAIATVKAANVDNQMTVKQAPTTQASL